MKQTRIILSEAETSKGILGAVSSAADLVIVASSVNGLETLRAVRELTPDLLLLDLALPDMHGLHVLRQLEYTTDTRTIILTDRTPQDLVTQAVLMGARGAVEKHASESVLLRSIRSVAGGDFWFSRDLTKALLEYLVSDNAKDGSIEAIRARLTPRESDVMVAVTWGLSNKQIAEKLNVSEHTVKQHLKQVFEKLNVSNRVELVLLALKRQHRVSSPSSRSGERARPARRLSR